MENPEFKKSFFYDIEVVENYTVERLNGATEYTIEPEQFLKHLNSLCLNTDSPMPNVLNYQIGYANIITFSKDKNKWIKWYNKNKCKDLRINK